MLRRITSSRAKRILLWILVTLLTLTVLLFVWTNWSGRRRWAQTKAMIEREGETLDFHKLLPETPPEAENLLAIEPLSGIAAVIDNDETKGEPGAKRKALESVKWATGSQQPPAAQGVTLGKPTDFQAWVNFLRETKYLDLPAGNVSANDVLAALDSKLPVVKQLADEASRRSKAMFTPGLKERQMPAMLLALPMPHYSHAQNLARALGLRARVALEAKNSAEAARSIIAIHRLAFACEKEPLLIGFLVGASMRATALEPLWLGLREHRFTDEDLRMLQESLFHEADAKPLLQAMRGELVAGVNAVEYLQAAAAGEGDGNEKVLGDVAGNGIDSKFWRLVPSGLFDHWKSAMGELELQRLVVPLKNSGLMQAVRAGDAGVDELKEKSNVLVHPDRLMVNLMMPAANTICVNGLLAEARCSQALAAIALERFFLKQGRLPAKLDELVPEFLSVVPLDLCDGKPMRYRVVESNRFTLWSVGLDGKDDNAKVTTDAKGNTKLNKRDYLGDWTWDYEPVEVIKTNPAPDRAHGPSE